jgi:hypothetical protein
MRVQNLILNAALISAISALVNLATASSAAACSCVAPSVESSYHAASDVVYVDVRRSFTTSSTRYYVGYVADTFKGCLRTGQRVILKTPVSSATCGSVLGFERYLINGHPDGGFLGTPVLAISLCSYDRPVAELTTHDLTFLNGRTVCCGGECSCADGSQPVQCLVDPCSVAPPCDAGKCVANYCGGCNAEFYDEGGERVCDGPVACKSDEDCAADSWCRQVQSDGSTDPSYACVPFVGEGARCNGFTAPWLYERCQPYLTCDTPDNVADAPGVCRASCQSNEDCKEGSYCASDKLCDDDGACEREVDCNLPGNDYAHIECVGHGVCGFDGRCGWECKPPQCVDLFGYDFGPCDAVLGWGVIENQCSELSGCSAGDFTLFATGDECRKTCEAASCEDLSGVDFGPCKRLLGAGVIAGMCQEIGGCDSQGHTLFEDIASCQRACMP